MRRLLMTLMLLEQEPSITRSARRQQSICAEVGQVQGALRLQCAGRRRTQFQRGQRY